VFSRDVCPFVCTLRLDLDLNLERKPIRGELLARPVTNVYMVLASNVCVCGGLACVARTSAKASAAACALCSKVLLGRDLAACDANIRRYKHPDC